jgi:UDP-N-acetylmuramoyl-tripeptide--D-alanyl-D-alanine ligase
VKKLAKKFVVSKLEWQVKKLYEKNDFKVVGVVGSIGKTSTKLAIAQTLSAGLRVRYQEGNYNETVTVPLIFFGEPTPSLSNPLAWRALFRRNQKQIAKPFPYDVVVVELGSDGPGQISEFKRYLKLDIAVVTAITPEHMENFSGLDDVAEEELSVKEFAQEVLANSDLCSPKYITGIETYSLSDKKTFSADGLSKPEIYSRLAAANVAEKLGLSAKQIDDGLKRIVPFSGRMQRLKGIKNSTIIDDSYNASPDAMKLALDTLYDQKAPQKIALLGNMNEMGGLAPGMHKDIGEYCDPKQLDFVATLGPDANKYLAPAAQAKGCKVHTFDSPYDAGEFIKQIIKPRAIILVKGSQNRVFSEEAIKSLLNDPNDQAKLVRQSKSWLAIKRKAFGK